MHETSRSSLTFFFQHIEKCSMGGMQGKRGTAAEEKQPGAIDGSRTPSAPSRQTSLKSMPSFSKR